MCGIAGFCFLERQILPAAVAILTSSAPSPDDQLRAYRASPKPTLDGPPWRSEVIFLHRGFRSSTCPTRFQPMAKDGVTHYFNEIYNYVSSEKSSTMWPTSLNRARYRSPSGRFRRLGNEAFGKGGDVRLAVGHGRRTVFLAADFSIKLSLCPRG